jgi:hypothetical protein
LNEEAYVVKGEDFGVIKIDSSDDEFNNNDEFNGNEDHNMFTV